MTQSTETRVYMQKQRAEWMTRMRGTIGRRLEVNSKWVLLSPTLLLVLLLGIYPLVYAVWVSLSKFETATMSPGPFAGLTNYVKIFSDWHFWNVLQVTGLFVLIVVPLELVLGLIVAVAFDVNNPWLRYLRSFLIIPTMIAPVSIGILWRLMYQSETGIINYFLSQVGVGEVLWLASPRVALWAVALVDIWEWTPFMFLILLAGLRGLPGDVIEAARVDGASSTQSFFYIKLPLLKNVVLVATLLRVLDAVRTYDTIYVLTRGGPAGATDLYSMYTFRQAFTHFNIDTAAALSIVFLILLSLLVPLVFIRLLGLRIEV
jgi:multiple sugar transport system permease protein